MQSDFNIKDQYTRAIRNEADSSYKQFEMEINKINSSQKNDVIDLIEEKTNEVSQMEFELKQSLDMIKQRLLDLNNYKKEVNHTYLNAEKQQLNEKETRVQKYKDHLKQKLQKKYEQLTGMLN